jgi:hypothetical protein
MDTGRIVENLGDSAKLYLRIAALRLRLQANETGMRTALALCAALCLVSAFAWFNIASFLWLRDVIGAVGCSLAMAAIYLATAGLLAAFALRRTQSSEAKEIAELETAVQALIERQYDEPLRAYAAFKSDVSRLAAQLSLMLSLFKLFADAFARFRRSPRAR